MQESTPSGTPSKSAYQPMSVNNELVRSSGGVTEDVRSLLIAGSMSWFGNAMPSKCEIDEPGATGSKVASRARWLMRSVPARIEVSTFIVTLTTPPTSAAFNALPSASVMRPDGMVMVASAPPSPGGGEPAALSAAITAMAPASCAFFTLTVNAQVPRSTSAILPATLLMMGSQASVVAPVPSLASTTSPVTPVALSCGPKLAGPNRNAPLKPGLLPSSAGSPGCSTFGVSCFTCSPVHDTLRMLSAEAARSAFVMLFQILLVLSSMVYCEYTSPMSSSFVPSTSLTRLLKPRP